MSQPKLGRTRLTRNGFPEVAFRDSYEVPCRLSASTVIFDYPDALQRPGTSAVWLGVAEVKARVMAKHAMEVGVLTKETTGWVDYPLPEQVLVSGSMHLNREHVAGLVARLQEWLDKGEFSD